MWESVPGHDAVMYSVCQQLILKTKVQSHHSTLTLKTHLQKIPTHRHSSAKLHQGSNPFSSFFFISFSFYFTIFISFAFWENSC